MHCARIIPVIDLMGGHVVHARRGQRDAYLPIETPLVRGSDPVDVARAVLAQCSTDADSASPSPPTLYVADLDALTGQALQRSSLERLVRALPGVTLWIDGGFDSAASARTTRDSFSSTGESLHSATGAARVRTVLASESLRDTRGLDDWSRGDAAILSLDSRVGTAMDPSGVGSLPECWPATVIVMTLERVGSDAGPDFDTLRRWRDRSSGAGGASSRCWVGAGGLRSMDDLAHAAQAGADAWLVASALHDGRLQGGTR
jgi:uncharacterized protein related to proFAR isomerase